MSNNDKNIFLIKLNYFKSIIDRNLLSITLIKNGLISGISMKNPNLEIKLLCYDKLSSGEEKMNEVSQ